MKDIYARALKVLPKRDLLRVGLVVFIQIGLSFLDLLGVALIGLLGALTIRGVQSQAPNGTLKSVLEAFGLSNMDFQQQAAILGISAAMALIMRTAMSIIFTRRILHFLSGRGAALSSNLVARMLSQPLTKVMSRTSQETLYALTNGVMNITLGVIGSSVSLISDFSLLLVLFIGLLLVDPIVALSTITLFSAIGILLYKLLHKKAQELGKSQAILTVESNEKIVEIVHGFREAAVKNRRGFYAKVISNLRYALSRDLAESAFLPYVGKYVIETTVILGALAISAVQFAISDAAHAVSTLSVFLAAGTRIAPAVLRMQQGGIQLKSALGSALPTIELIEELSSIQLVTQVEDSSPKFEYPGFKAEIKVDNVSYRYPGKDIDALTKTTLEILDGEFVAFVGSSGAGKSTLADLILGLLVPSTGSISISGQTPTDAINRWPGALAYVPQEVLITNGSIFENVALGFEPKDVSNENVVRAINLAQLNDLITELPDGVKTPVGERGAKLSGGQRQRLGIARALYTNPRLLVLDEATSALDGKTEADISLAITALKRSVTVVMIAHRLSTVREADKIIYLSNGEVIAIGNFNEVRERVPEFDQQAKLMGL